MPRKYPQVFIRDGIRCKGIKKNGEPCGNCHWIHKSGYCQWHRRQAPLSERLGDSLNLFTSTNNSDKSSELIHDISTNISTNTSALSSKKEPVESSEFNELEESVEFVDSSKFMDNNMYDSEDVDDPSLSTDRQPNDSISSNVIDLTNEPTQISDSSNSSNSSNPTTSRKTLFRPKKQNQLNQSNKADGKTTGKTLIFELIDEITSKNSNKRHAAAEKRAMEKAYVKFENSVKDLISSEINGELQQIKNEYDTDIDFDFDLETELRSESTHISLPGCEPISPKIVLPKRIPEIYLGSKQAARLRDAAFPNRFAVDEFKSNH
jgi:hypothetical protein